MRHGARETNIALASIITAIAEVDPDGPVPLGPAYMALNQYGYDLAAFQRMTDLLHRAEVCVVTAETIRLTDRGRHLAAQIEAHAAEARRRA